MSVRTRSAIRAEKGCPQSALRRAVAEWRIAHTPRLPILVILRVPPGSNDPQTTITVRKRTSPTSHTSANPLSFLRALSSVPGSVYSAAYSEQLALHRSSIAHHLSSLLAAAGARQRELQERRMRARRNKELHEAGISGLALGAAGGGEGAASRGAAKAGQGEGGNQERMKALQGATRGIRLDPSFAPVLLSEEEEAGRANGLSGSHNGGDGGADVLSTLSAEQIQRFESENSALLRSLEEDLASVQQAEQKLYAISELQTQLLQHLGQQAELTDRLLEESVHHTTEVGQGNAQLRKAKERSRDANNFLAIFLVGSGLGLLFLHCESCRAPALDDDVGMEGSNHDSHTSPTGMD